MVKWLLNIANCEVCWRLQCRKGKKSVFSAKKSATHGMEMGEAEMLEEFDILEVRSIVDGEVVRWGLINPFVFFLVFIN